jgi:hypothetical protein
LQRFSRVKFYLIQFLMENYFQFNDIYATIKVAKNSFKGLRNSIKLFGMQARAP